MKRWVTVALTFAVLIGTVGCSQNRTYKVVFANRLSAGHTIECFSNGELLGTVLPGSSAEFSVETRRLQSPSPTAPDPASTASVTFAARDLATGLLSREFSRAIATDRTEYVEINAQDF